MKPAHFLVIALGLIGSALGAPTIGVAFFPAQIPPHPETVLHPLGGSAPMAAAEAEVEIQNQSIFNSLVYVTAGYNATVFPIPMKKNSVYSFYFQTETPYANSYALEVWLISPSGKSYKCHVHASTLRLNKSYDYFEFGAAENGTHQLNVIISTSHNLNIHFNFRFLDTLDNYYKFKSKDLKAKQTYAYLFYADIACFNANNKQKIYEFPLLENVEYAVNFFRVVPAIDAINTVFQEPYLTGTLWQAGTDELVIYPYWTDYKVQSSGYALSTNKVFEYASGASGFDFSAINLQTIDWGFLDPNNVNFLAEEVTLADICPLDTNIAAVYEDNADAFVHPLNNPRVNVHLGIAKAGTSRFHLSLDLPENTFDRDLNYVFLIHGVKTLAEGPANDSGLPPPDEETHWFDWLNETQNSTFTETWGKINDFILINTDTLLFVLVPACALLIGIDYYRKLRRPKIATDPQKAKGEEERS